jgi:hypothetical protein
VFRVLALFVAGLLWPLAGAAQPPPVLEIDAPASMAAARARVEAFDPRRLVSIVRLVGLDHPGPPIIVVLAGEDSATARRATPWTAGLAYGSAGVVVLFPARSPTYPHDTLEDVLRHEVAHVLIDRAARGQRVPRWFHEGLAMMVERPWRLEDRTRFVVAFALGRPVATDEIDRLFTGDRHDQGRAYPVAGAFVRELLAEHGGTLPARLLARTSRGVPFERAFHEVTGIPLGVAERRFWESQRMWTRWLPFATSASAIWMVVTVLAVWAMRIKRRRNAERRRRWDQEEELWRTPVVAPPLALVPPRAADEAPPRPDSGSETVH